MPIIVVKSPRDAFRKPIKPAQWLGAVEGLCGLEHLDGECERVCDLPFNHEGPHQDCLFYDSYSWYYDFELEAGDIFSLIMD